MASAAAHQMTCKDPMSTTPSLSSVFPQRMMVSPPSPKLLVNRRPTFDEYLKQRSDVKSSNDELSSNLARQHEPWSVKVPQKLVLVSAITCGDGDGGGDCDGDGDHHIDSHDVISPISGVRFGNRVIRSCSNR